MHWMSRTSRQAPLGISVVQRRVKTCRTSLDRVCSACCAGTPGTVEVEGASEAVTSMLQLMRDARASPLMTLMVAFPRRLASVPFDGAVVTNSPVLEWVARDSSKPGDAAVEDSDDRPSCWACFL